MMLPVLRKKAFKPWTPLFPDLLLNRLRWFIWKYSCKEKRELIVPIPVLVHDARRNT